MGRRYRKRSQSSQILRDLVIIGSKSHPINIFILGLLLFIIFYFITPMWIVSISDNETKSHITEAIKVFMSKRIHYLEYIGITCGVISLYFTIRNSLVPFNAESNERSLVGFLSKLLSRWIN